MEHSDTTWVTQFISADGERKLEKQHRRFSLRSTGGFLLWRCQNVTLIQRWMPFSSQPVCRLTNAENGWPRALASHAGGLCFFGIERSTHQPLQGHVDELGFEITESHLERDGWWFENPMLYVRGEWFANGPHTRLRLMPSLKWRQYLVDLYYGAAYAFVGTLLTLIIMQSMPGMVAGAIFLGTTMVFTLAISRLTRAAARKRYAEMVQKLETLLDAQNRDSNINHERAKASR